jgi:hypothetical protein
MVRNMWPDLLRRGKAANLAMALEVLISRRAARRIRSSLSEKIIM